MSADQHEAVTLETAMFMVITTHRRNGQTVPTTVWFSQEGSKLYVTTARMAGKTKRIQANPLVTVAPSDQIGNLLGAAIPGRARVLADDETALAEASLRRKYGAMYDQTTRQMDADRPPGSRVFIEVELD